MAGARGGQLGPAGEMLVEVFAPFDLASATGKAPTRTFEDQLVLRVGDKEVRLKKLGPAHTAGDLVVHVPGDRAVFTGDILFNGVTPIMWAGPVAKLAGSLRLDHGPGCRDHRAGSRPAGRPGGSRPDGRVPAPCGPRGTERYDAGMPAAEAGLDIALGEFRHWPDAERIAANVIALYREYAGDTSPPDVVGVFSAMAAVRRQLRG